MTPTTRLEHALAWVRDGFVKPPPGFAEDQDAQALDRAAKLFQATFASAEGEAVLQLLLEATLFRPPVDCRLPEHEYLRFAQLREGQNAAVAIILFYLDHASERTTHGGRQPEPEPGSGAYPPSAFFDGLADQYAGGRDAAGEPDPGTGPRGVVG